jgi:hypothetical protein
MNLLQYFLGHAAEITTNFVGVILAVTIGAFLKSYMTTWAKRAATKEDLEKLENKVSLLTTTAENIKADVRGALWEKQNRWESKRDFYVQAVDLIERTLRVFRNEKRLLSKANYLPTEADEESFSEALLTSTRKWSRLSLELDMTMKKGRLFIDNAVLAAWDETTAAWQASRTDSDLWEQLKRGVSSTGPGSRLFNTVRDRRKEIPARIEALERLQDQVFQIAEHDLRLTERAPAQTEAPERPRR